MRELAEVAGRSNREALEVINQRALESFEEIKQAMTASGAELPARTKS